ncbi:MAG TPA: hypothetical protein VFP84_26060 [Kofleriaceae bacterium]|nr:hypothetical protein [Kofleriaceae bacterium]
MAVCATAVAASCGDDGTSNGGLADAPPGGGKLDAGDGTPPPVTLTVTRNGAPVEGVHTYFLNPDHTVAATVDTDATGTATAALPLGGTVTAIDPFPHLVATVLRTLAAAPVIIGDNELRTFAGVKPGDHLVLGRNDKTVSFTLRLPQSEPLADQYQVATPCGGGFAFPGGGGGGSDATPGGSFQLTGCPAKLDIAVVAIANGRTVGALVHPAAEINSDGVVDLTGDAYAAATTRQFAYPNAPDIAITTAHTLVSASGAFGPFGPAGGMQVSIDEPAIAGATGITDAQIRLNGTHHVIDAGPLAATTSTDLTGQLLPDFNGQPGYNPTNHLVTWIEDTQNLAVLHGQTADLTITALDVSRENRVWHWTVAAPYAPGKVEFPTLPTDLADWSPNFETDGITVSELINVKLPGGYDQARAHIFDVNDALGNGSLAALATGITGRVVAVEAGRNVAAAGARTATQPRR